MAFQEVEESTCGGPGSFGPFALPVSWASVADLTCPVCGRELEEFAHVSRYTCYDCGFYIATGTLERIKSFIKFGEYQGPGISRGYGFGLTQFKNETPF